MRDSKKYTFDKNMLDKLFADFKKNQLPALMLSISEPLLFKNIESVIKRAEEANVSIRNTRRSIVNEFRALEKSKEMSQDEVKRASKDLQDITDGFVEKISELSKFKEKDIIFY